MLDFPWKIFSMTGNIDTYLLMKEIEKDLERLNLLKKEQENEKVDVH